MDIFTLLEPFPDTIIRRHIAIKNIGVPDSICFLTPETIPEENVLYLSDSCCDEALLPLLYRLEHCTVFLWGTESWQPVLDWSRVSCNCIIVSAAPAKVYNYLNQVLRKYRSWQELSSRLNSSDPSLQQILELASAAGDCFIAVCSRSGELICSDSTDKLSQEAVRELVNPSDSGEQPKCSVPPSLSSTEKYSAVLMLSSDNCLAAVSGENNDLPYYLSLFAECTEAALRREGFSSGNFDEIMEKALDGSVTDEETLAASLCSLFNVQKSAEGRTYYLLCVLRPEQELPESSVNSLRRFFQDTFRFRTMLYKGDIIMMSVFREKDNLLAIKHERFLNDHNWTAKALENKLQAFRTTACFSIPTGFFDRLRSVYLLCLNTLRLHTLFQGDKAAQRLIYCSDYQIWNIIDYCAERFREVYKNDDLVTLITPEVVLLRKYDLIHNDYLSDILRIYLNSGKKIDITAQKAFVHRNTVSRKLEKIAELTHLDLDDAMVQLQIMLSLQMLEYYESFFYGGKGSNNLKLRIQPE